MSENYNEIDRTPEFFAGREVIFARLNQSLMNQMTSHALVLAGRDGTGKSTLLNRFRRVFGQNIPAVLVSLTEIPLPDEKTLLLDMVQRTGNILEEYGFAPRRLPPVPAQGTGDEALSDDDYLPVLRAWLRDEYLKELMYIIRPQRRLVWLLDDAEALFTALDEKRITTETITFLHDLTVTHGQFGIVLALNLEYEHRLIELAPLVNPAEVLRPGALTPEEGADLLRQVSPLFTDRAVDLIYQQSGGHPRLLQRFCQVLSEHPMANISSDSLDDVIDRVYEESAEEFKTDWQRLNRDERLVLTAVSGLLYRHEERLLNAAMIADWLESHDYPLREISVHAAIRGLEYRTILLNREQGMTLNNGLFLRWLLENARLDTRPAGLTRWLWRAFGLGAGIIALLMGVLYLNAR